MNNLLLIFSCALFLTGLWFPIAAMSFNPFLAYGILTVSLPVWAIGAICGGVVGFRSGKDVLAISNFPRLGWGLCALNLIAGFAVFCFSFSAS